MSPSRLGRHVRALLPVAILAASGCSRGPSPAPVPAAEAGTAPATAPSPPPVDGGAASPPTASADPPALDAGPSPLPLSSAVVVTSGDERPLDRNDVTLVEPTASFRIEVAAQITDGRLALHDAQDAMVASSGTTEVGPSWTRFQLTPDEPLRPGSGYTLQLDGSLQRNAHDPSGRAYAPVTISLRTTGERPQSPKKKRGGR